MDDKNYGQGINLARDVDWTCSGNCDRLRVLVHHASINSNGLIDVPSSDINVNYVHDSYFTAGSCKVYVTPQSWSVIAIFLGCLLVVCGLLGTLRATP